MTTPPPIPPLGKKIVVEPLDSERLTRIERNVVSRAVDAAPARVRRQSWFGLAAAVGATALAAGVVGWIAHGRALPTGGTTPALALTAPMRVHTDAQASTVDIGDATIASGPATEYAVTRPDGGVLVDMTHGKVELDVGKRGARPPLVVRAGDTDVFVIGTHFTVDDGDGHGAVEVSVREGRVRVVHGQHAVFVSAGETWSSATEVVELVALGGGSGDGGSGSGGGGGAVIGDAPTLGSGSGYTIAAIGPGPNVLHPRTSVVPDAVKPVVATPAHRVDDTANGDHMSKGAKVMLDNASDPHAEILADIRAVALAPMAAVTSSDPAKDYRDAAGASVKDAASIQLYSLARYQESKLGRTEDALKTIDEYRRRFVHGAELGDILWLSVRIHCLDRHWDSSCHAAADLYLAKQPNGPGVNVAELIRATD